MFCCCLHRWESGAEFVRRLDVWAANHDYIEHINAQNHSYKLGHNRYSHMTLDEFHQRFKVLSTNSASQNILTLVGSLVSFSSFIFKPPRIRYVTSWM